MARASQGFPPIARPDARVLILGSLPGRMSLQMQQYYAQPQNSFWRIMGALFGAGPEQPYAVRTRTLCAAGIALWDVCRAAVRPGSLDSAIDLASVVPNDFVAFFAAHPRIRLVCLNGGTAARLFDRFVVPRLPAALAGLPAVRLPSTSPAHASLRFEQKLELWQVVRSGCV
jgi:double-stranded uracil-DNA glycosylase